MLIFAIFPKQQACSRNKFQRDITNVRCAESLRFRHIVHLGNFRRHVSACHGNENKRVLWEPALEFVLVVCWNFASILQHFPVICNYPFQLDFLYGALKMAEFGRSIRPSWTSFNLASIIHTEVPMNIALLRGLLPSELLHTFCTFCIVDCAGHCVYCETYRQCRNCRKGYRVVGRRDGNRVCAPWPPGEEYNKKTHQLVGKCETRRHSSNSDCHKKYCLLSVVPKTFVHYRVPTRIGEFTATTIRHQPFTLFIEVYT